MKHIFAFILSLCCVTALSAQGVVRSGLYTKNGEVVYSDPQSSVTVSVTVKSTNFEPGEFARYAQKMLGVRASLAEKCQTEIVSAEICDKEPLGVEMAQCQDVKQTILPIFKSDNRAQSVEQQAAAAAEMIFSLRRSRKELITGDAGEHVFGAGLAAALAKIDAMEQQCLDMFYGTTTTKIDTYNYTITPVAAEKNYILARYREGVGVVGVSDLSGDPIMLYFTPQAVDTSALPVAGEKDKSKAQFAVPAMCKVELLLGTQTLDAVEREIYQYGQSVTLALPLVK